MKILATALAVSMLTGLVLWNRPDEAVPAGPEWSAAPMVIGEQGLPVVFPFFAGFIGKLVGAVLKIGLVKEIWKGVKKVFKRLTKSTLGKVVLAVAAFYTAGAAMAAWGGSAAAGASGLSGFGKTIAAVAKGKGWGTAVSGFKWGNIRGAIGASLNATKNFVTGGEVFPEYNHNVASQAATAHNQQLQAKADLANQANEAARASLPSGSPVPDRLKETFLPTDFGQLKTAADMREATGGGGGLLGWAKENQTGALVAASAVGSGLENLQAREDEEEKRKREDEEFARLHGYYQEKFPDHYNYNPNSLGSWPNNLGMVEAARMG